jgi:hypothetical protein
VGGGEEGRSEGGMKGEREGRRGGARIVPNFQKCHLSIFDSEISFSLKKILSHHET